MAVCSLCEIMALSMARLRFQHRCTEADMADTFIVPLVIVGISIQVCDFCVHWYSSFLVTANILQACRKVYLKHLLFLCLLREERVQPSQEAELRCHHIVGSHTVRVEPS